LTHAKPSQHGVVAVQVRPSPLHNPASAAGLEQLSYIGPASPVQKHEASSNVMHVYAAQYGVSAVRLGNTPVLASNEGMHTVPSS
jgi:hypothetical protein